MPVNLSPPNPAQLYPIAGVRLGVAEAGIRKANRKDLVSPRKCGALVAAAAVKGLFLEPANNLWSRFCQP